MVLFVEPFDFVVHDQSTECFVGLCCHNTFAKSYDSKVGLIFKNVAFLLPFLLHSCYRFRCTTVTIYVALWLPLLLHFSIPVTLGSCFFLIFSVFLREGITLQRSCQDGVAGTVTLNFNVLLLLRTTATSSCHARTCSPSCRTRLSPQIKVEHTDMPLYAPLRPYPVSVVCKEKLHLIEHIDTNIQLLCEYMPIIRSTRCSVYRCIEDALCHSRKLFFLSNYDVHRIRIHRDIHSRLRYILNQVMAPL